MTAPYLNVPVFTWPSAPGGLLYTYAPGGVSAKTTYAADGTTPNANPVVLDANGTAVVRGEGVYHFLLKDSTGATTLWDADYYQGAPLSQEIIGGFLYLRSAGEISAGVTPTFYAYPEGDIRRYGADLTDADNSTAINNALSVSSNGGQAAFIPAGTWNYTAQLSAVGGSSMYGVGQGSILAPNGCAGIAFATQGTYQGTRFFRDFEINGVATSGNNGIICNFTAASGSRITQVKFSNLTINGFQQAVYARGMWNCVFEDCWLYNNYQGYLFTGQSIQCTIRGGFCQKQTAAGAVTGTGTQYGLLVNSVSSESCQSLKVTGWGVYAYDIDICLSLALYTVIEHCDVSVAVTTGIQLVTLGGGTIVRDCWIQTNFAGPTTGILLSALGSPTNDKVVIEGNQIVCNIADAGSVGINIGNNHNAVTTNNNTIGTATAPFAQAIVNNNCDFQICKYNTIYASSVAISVHSSSNGVEIGPNITQGGTPLTFTGLTPAGFTFYGSGSYTFALTGTSSATSTATWVANGRTVVHTFPNAGTVGANSGGAITLVGSGFPAYLNPVTTRRGLICVQENSANQVGIFTWTQAGVLTIYKDPTGAVFSAAGNRGLLDQIRYEYT